MEYKAGMWVRGKYFGTLFRIIENDSMDKGKWHVRALGEVVVKPVYDDDIEPINIKIALSDDMEQAEREFYQIEDRAKEHGVNPPSLGWAPEIKYLFLYYSDMQTTWCGREMESEFDSHPNIELTPAQYLGIDEYELLMANTPVNGSEVEPEKRLSTLGLALQEEFEVQFGDGGCSCHINPPCSYCTHPGNPIALEETPEAWVNHELIIDRRSKRGGWARRDELVAECHQDHAVNRAMVQDELGYQSRPTIKFKCPYCEETGTKDDIKDHLIRVEEEHPPSDDSPAWLKWMV